MNCLKNIHIFIQIINGEQEVVKIQILETSYKVLSIEKQTKQKTNKKKLECKEIYNYLTNQDSLKIYDFSTNEYKKIIISSQIENYIKCIQVYQSLQKHL